MKGTQIGACPSYKANWSASGGADSGNIGYAYNYYYLSPSTYDASWNEMPSVAYLSQAMHPSTTVLMADGAQWDNYSSSTPFLKGSAYLDPPSVSNPGFHGLHNGFGNVLFLDGHVKAMKPTYHSGSFGYGYNSSDFVANQLGDIDSDGDLTTDEMFTLN